MSHEGLKLYKMTAAGNDFLLVDVLSAEGGRSWGRLTETRERLVQQLCDRHYGVGADGLLFLEPASNTHARLRWDFYNSDGSKADMCGNAARCVVRLALKRNWSEGEVVWETTTGLRRGWVSEKGVHVELPAVETPSTKAQSWKVGSHSLNYFKLNSGVPHAVFPDTKKLSRTQLFELAQEVRAAKEFGEAGTNVTFILNSAEEKIDIVTFERGVEDFTLACGTGAIAAAAIHRQLKQFSQVTVHAPGGLLQVDLSGKFPILIGPADFVAEVHLLDR